MTDGAIWWIRNSVELHDLQFMHLPWLQFERLEILPKSVATFFCHLWYSSIEFFIHQMAPSVTLAASYIWQHVTINNNVYLEMPYCVLLVAYHSMYSFIFIVICLMCYRVHITDTIYCFALKASHVITTGTTLTNIAPSQKQLIVLINLTIYCIQPWHEKTTKLLMIVWYFILKASNSANSLVLSTCVLRWIDDI